MQIRVFVLPNGKIQIFVDEGTFEEAKVKTQEVIACLQAQGLAAEVQGDIEQHRPDGPSHVHLVKEVRHEQ